MPCGGYDETIGSPHYILYGSTNALLVLPYSELWFIGAIETNHDPLLKEIFHNNWT